MIAKVLLDLQNIKMNKVFDYIVPEKFENEAKTGKRILVNFGKGKGHIEEGIIVSLSSEEYLGKYKLKSILEVLDEEPVVDKEMLSFCKKMSKLYFCNVYEFLKLFFPPGTTRKFVSKDYDGKKVNSVKLAKSQEEIIYDIENDVISSPKHIRLLKFVINVGGSILQGELMDALNISTSVINTLVKNKYIEIEKIEIKKEVIDYLAIKPSFPLKLTDYQMDVYDKICKKIDEDAYSKILLRGITGSGKTEIYLQTIAKVLEKGKTAIVLVPEIALTYQMTERFISRFGKNIAVLHSKMTLSERRQEWKRINNSEVNIVIGARSALFAPLKNLGLVIIDEEHDTSYISQSSPKYSAKEVAKELCKLKDATLILGSATPEIAEYYKASNDDDYMLLEMLQRPGKATLPEVYIVDKKEEYKLGHVDIFSKELIDEIYKTKERKEQTLLFINRRGHSSYTVCSNCGETLKCKNCDVTLTYHKNLNLNICHYCGYVEKERTLCLSCNKETLIKEGLGTEKIEEVVKEVLKDVSTIRMDLDTTAGRDGHKKILSDFKDKNIDILVGTQMISKGHDIPNVTLVGILNIDSMLAINDYLAHERVFSNVMQVAGRSGRSDKPGKVFIETFASEHYVLQAAKKHDYISFYNQEIEFRKLFSYPPFRDILLFEVINKDANIVKNDIDLLYRLLMKINCDGYRVMEPKSPFIQKINNNYRKNIVVKCDFSEDIGKYIYKVLELFEDKKNKKTKISVAKNPIFM